MATDSERNLPILKVEGKEKTTVGNYFISNYPPYSFWTPQQRDHVDARFDAAPALDSPMGLYVHIPFCRKRCDFCYFKVYTDKNSTQIRRYLDAVIEECRLLARRPGVRDRGLDFIYFGGGTPSYLSVEQLKYLFDGLQEHLPWDGVKEVAFECEPGTLQEKKIHALRDMGVTRLSLGVENFDPEILELNNRAHRAKEIFRSWDFIKAADYPQVNIDLIAGMVGETDDNWKDCLDKTLQLAPESVTIYQLEVPYNTTLYQRMRDGQTQVAPVADWDTKRRWVSEGFDHLMADGYSVASAYTAIKDKSVDFLYRDALWRGADMVGLGVSSIAHFQGVHYQNEHQFESYVQRVEAGELPIARALELTQDELLIREFILQLKLGHLDVQYFHDKFKVNVVDRFADALAEHASEGYLKVSKNSIELSREGLLRADGLLPAFFLESHRDARYA
ncbi:MAG: coproporphyrinogen-III oxidase family protein [Planctomycetota bacterium]|nr:coproporphyrinogen-III oxidase family protein [Planctomycetota bacterium]